MGVNVDHIRVTKLDDRIGDDEQSPTVCFSYGAASKSLKTTDLKQAKAALYNTNDHFFSGTNKNMICPQIKCEQETQNDTKSEKQVKQEEAEPMINLSCTNNIFEVNTSSLLIESGH